MKKSVIAVFTISFLLVILAFTWFYFSLINNDSIETSGGAIDYTISFKDRSIIDRVFFKFFNKEWEKRVDEALETYDCEEIPQENLPDDSYKGPLIDTHLHIPPLPDGFGDGEDNEKSLGVDADLYDQIPNELVPLLGKSVTIGKIACTLQQEGSMKVFAFFSVFPESPIPLIEVAKRTMEEYPLLFVPFIQSTGEEISTVEAEILRKMLDVEPNLFKGLGEIGDSPTEPINLPSNDPIYLGDFEVAKEQNLIVYFHPGWEDHENLEDALQQFPEVTFIVHADNIRPYIKDLMDRNQNIYFTANDLFEEHIPKFRFGEKEVFIEAMERDWDILLDDAVEMYKPLIEAHPDRFMWGTDRADIAWTYDEDVGILLARYGRAFIGRLNPEVQENFAYKNAERLID
jgi:hypothetical protein